MRRIHDQHAAEKAAIDEKMVEARCVALTGDHWTSVNNDNYLGVRAVTVAVTTASPAVVGCHRGCVLPPAVVHVTSHTL